MFKNPDKHLAHHQTITMLSVAVVVITLSGLMAARAGQTTGTSGSFYEPGFDDVSASIGPDDGSSAYRDWVRPPGPVRVGLQAGHWLAAEAPDELENIRENGGYAAGHEEWRVNLDIAKRTASLLEKRGIIVDVLPATVPPGYLADAFVSIHADDNDDTSVTGYKVASPYRDLSKRADWLALLIDEEYAVATNLPADPNVTPNMRGYYAFNWRRYQHSIHPMTPGALLETGFLSSARDRKIIVRNPDVAAEALARAIVRFLSAGPATDGQ